MRIALTGKRGSGKSTLASQLAEPSDGSAGYARLSIAEPVREVALVMVNAAIEAMRPYSGRKDPITREEMAANKEVFRPLLQWLSTEFGREYLGNENIWIWRLIDHLDRYPPGANVVVDDVRFGNEVEALRDEGFRIVHVERPSGDRPQPTPVDLHASERQMFTTTPDATIVNDGAEDNLEAEMQRHIDRWRWKE